jgi:hypothetical protein
MAKRPTTDTAFQPDHTVYSWLEKKHYNSPEWSRDAGIKDRDRGLGIVEVDDEAADSVSQTDQLPDRNTRRG